MTIPRCLWVQIVLLRIILSKVTYPEVCPDSSKKFRVFLGSYRGFFETPFGGYFGKGSSPNFAFNIKPI